MEVVIQLSPEAARDTAAGQPGAMVRERVRELGLTLQPIDPGGDAALSTYYRVEAPSAESAARVIEAVRGLPHVTAAYIKPTDEAP
jgi:hypothetical protein